MIEVPADQKVFVLDTSLLVHDPESPGNFGRNIVVIPMTVLEELDELKTFRDLRGDSAREATNFLRLLNAGRTLGTTGAITKSGGTIIVDFQHAKNGGHKSSALNYRKADNKILSVAQYWKTRNSRRPVILVTKDINLSLKANAAEIDCEDYRNDRLVEGVEEIYSGLVNITLTESEAKLINELGYKDTVPLPDLVKRLADENLKLNPNHCCRLFHPNDHENYALAIYKDNKNDPPYFKAVLKANKQPRRSINPVNDEQAFAYALASDPEITVLSMLGKHGTGKTLTTLLAGHEQVARKRYSETLVYRPIYAVERQDLGFLPGDLAEKFSPWTQPIFDNMSLILRSGREATNDLAAKTTEQEISDKNIVKKYINDCFLSIEPLTFIRGRSIHWRFMMVDECQNITPLTAKSVVARAAEHSKIILAGDIWQIDNHYLDKTSNGLVHAIHRLKGQPEFGHISLFRNERKGPSLLAELL